SGDIGFRSIIPGRPFAAHGNKWMSCFPRIVRPDSNRLEAITNGVCRACLYCALRCESGLEGWVVTFNPCMVLTIGDSFSVQSRNPCTQHGICPQEDDAVVIAIIGIMPPMIDRNNNALAIPDDAIVAERNTRQAPSGRVDHFHS